MPLGFSRPAGRSGFVVEEVFALFALDSLSNTALALLKRDTLLAVRFRPPLEPRDGDEVVDPLMLLLLPLVSELFSLSPRAVEFDDEELALFSRSIDIA